MEKEVLIAEIRKITKRIGQAARSGVTELAERLRISRTALAAELASRFNLWLLVNAEGQSEFVDRKAFDERCRSWKERVASRSSGSRPVAEEPPPTASAPPDPVREFFGDPIHVYTRREALEDGTLVDVSRSAAGCFKHPVAVTAALWAIVEDLPGGPGGAQEVDQRVREILRSAVWVAMAGPKNADRVTFQIALGTSKGIRSLDLVAVCGSGDDGNPVITIGFPIDF